ncbi:uncharacterized protein LOC126613890 isoform X2 [Malus sylvestris]|uniref:uncharacterized protein isoform X2 n=1 Tax=Malus domestica TaxID=3750 RepID=UPI00049898A6|nr:uncharacterized protein LOC103418549 isoform X2 [Malus domestica]XP_050137467.1 uncharacterized protein LOC126613890 isoform X2 [Malus sylvestris]
MGEPFVACPPPCNVIQIPNPEFIQSQDQEQIPPPPNEDELAIPGRLHWHWFDEEEEHLMGGEDLPGVSYVLEDSYEAQMAAREKTSKIMAQRLARTSPEDKENWDYCSHDPAFVYMICGICSRRGHWGNTCPYQYYVPRNAAVGPGGRLVCRCCEKEGGHSDPDDDEWIGVAFVNDCGTCGAVGKHRSEDCPKKEGTGKIDRKTALRKKKQTSVPRKKKHG